MKIQKFYLCLFLATLTFPLLSQEKTTAGSGAAVYMVVYRTPAHVRTSKPDVFHSVANDLLSFLQEKGVAIKIDPERGTIETEAQMSLSSMVNITKQLGASNLLFVTVDRPMSKWIKVTVECYNLDGKLLWTEEASDGGGMSGKGGVERTMDKLQSALTKHLGSEGLPVNPAKPVAEVTKP